MPLTYTWDIKTFAVTPAPTASIASEALAGNRTRGAQAVAKLDAAIDAASANLPERKAAELHRQWQEENPKHPAAVARQAEAIVI